MDAVTKRVMSARRTKIIDQKNQIESLSRELIDVRSELKLLRRQNVISERQLDKYEATENDMGNILTKHSEEIRTHKEQLRKQKEKFTRTSKKLKDTEDELEKTRRLLKKMRGLVEDNQLGERDELARKLTKAEERADQSDRKVMVSGENMLSYYQFYHTYLILVNQNFFLTSEIINITSLITTVLCNNKISLADPYF